MTMFKSLVQKLIFITLPNGRSRRSLIESVYGCVPEEEEGGMIYEGFPQFVSTEDVNLMEFVFPFSSA